MSEVTKWKDYHLFNVAAPFMCLLQCIQALILSSDSVFTDSSLTSLSSFTAHCLVMPFSVLTHHFAPWLLTGSASLPPPFPCTSSHTHQIFPVSAFLPSSNGVGLLLYSLFHSSQDFYAILLVPFSIFAFKAGNNLLFPASVFLQVLFTASKGERGSLFLVIKPGFGQCLLRHSQELQLQQESCSDPGSSNPY